MTHLLAHRLLLLEPIGEGGTGAVRRAWDLRRGRSVAAKLLPRASYDVRRAEPRLHHPHVLTVDEVLTTRHLVALLMPLARGGTADRLLPLHGGVPPHLLAGLPRPRCCGPPP